MSGPDSSRDVGQDDFLFHLYRGSELLQDNHVLEAKQELEQALTMQPLDAKGQDLLGTVYFRLGLYPRAIQIYEGLESQFQTDVSIKINLALCYLKTGQPEPARRVLRDAVQINPAHKRAWGYLGLALQKLGDLEQAQIAFERGGRVTMARRMTESLRPAHSRQPPPEPEPASGPDISQSVRDTARTAFLELDAGELRFALAEPESPGLGAIDGQWHTVELGGASKGVPRSPYSKTLPPPWMGEADATRESLAPPGAPSPSSLVPQYVPPAQPATPAAPLPSLSPVRADPAAFPARIGPPAPPARTAIAPSLFIASPERIVAMDPSGALVVQTGGGAGHAFAARLDALRIVGGAVTTRVLNRRTRDADTGEVLGGIGSPLVRIDGDARLILGARGGHAITLLTLGAPAMPGSLPSGDDHLAFVREDLLLGFDLRLAYENGRVALDPAAEAIPPSGTRTGGEGVPIVQLRGSGAFALELTGKLATVSSVAGRPLLVRREWIVGWFGRLVTRALPSAESPGGHRGLVGFSGEGTVLVCVRDG